MPTVATRRQEELSGELVSLFLAEGFRQFTIAALADRMHCSKTTLYALGHSREAIVVNALVRFFRTAADQIEARVAAEPDPSGRIVVYLAAVADALRPASPQFFADLAAHPAASAVYERNTRLAADRVERLIADGKGSGSFRAVDGGFVAEVVTTTMTRIQSGEVRRASGLSDAEAYDELTGLVLRGIAS